jgi:hypothetical protein
MSYRVGGLARACGLLAALALVLLGLAAPRAGAQDRVYWTEGETGNGFGFAALDGSGGGLLGLQNLEWPAREGFTIDTADGRIFWGSRLVIESIGFDGTGQRRYDSGAVKVSEAHGLTIDPAGRRLIWSQGAVPRIAVAALEGGGGGGLAAPGTEIFPGTNPAVFDPASGRVYWGAAFNFASPQTTKVGIGYAAIDGSGGGILPLPPTAEPSGGLALDDLGGRVYWITREKIMSMKLDGSDLAPLETGTAKLVKPGNIAIDEATRTLYWTNKGAHAISFAKFDGSGAVGQLNLAGSPPGGTVDLALFLAPRLLAAPAVSGDAAPGATLTCTSGAWAPDQPQAKLFDAPASLAYQWTRDGAPIAGATEATLVVPAAGASYGCTVTASNAAGSTSAATGTVSVPAPPPPVPVGFGASPAVTVALAPGQLRGAEATVTIENFNTFAVDGNLTASASAKRGSQPLAFGAQSFRVGPGSSTVATLRLPPPLLKHLHAQARLGVWLSATVADPLGARREVTASALATAKRVKPKHKHPKPKHHRRHGAAS